jgi:hypothetical protein
MHWKVVFRNDERLESAWIDPAQSPLWAVIYEPGKRTTPLIEGSKLFCFDSLENARDFGMGFGEIWECKAENPTPCTLMASPDEKSMRRFWGGEAGLHQTLSTPIGSVWADSLTLTRKVWPPP